MRDLKVKPLINVNTQALNNNNQLDIIKTIPLLEIFERKNLYDLIPTNTFINEFNVLITNFNNASVNEKKNSALQDILNRINEINCLYKPSQLAKSPKYQEICATLFKEIKTQLSVLGRSSLIIKNEASSLAKIIANMSPARANQLLEILINWKKNTKDSDGEQKLLELYNDASKEEEEEAKAFKQFLDDYIITRIDGMNSDNFKVSHLDDNIDFVLKVDNRLDMPKTAEIKLRSQLAENFVPIETERQAYCQDEEDKTISRTIQVTKFCAGGSILEYRFKQITRNKQTTCLNLVSSTGKVFQQMADILLAIQKQNYIFPDAKITNWLVDDIDKANIKLMITDTKSFISTSNGKYINGSSRWLHTEGFFLPEYHDHLITVDSAHAYLLGINLYTYVTNKLPIKNKFNFTDEFFTNSNGKEYKKLIEDLVKQHPKDRISLQEASKRLILINNPDLMSDVLDLQALKFGANDKVMDKYIYTMLQKINKATNPYEKQQVLAELKTQITIWKNNDGIKKLRSIITEFREKSGIFTIGMIAKAERIEKAIAALPLEQRLNCMESLEVQKAIASHRHIGRSSHLTKDGNINNINAAKLYKNIFKNRKFENTNIDTTNSEKMVKIKN